MNQQRRLYRKLIYICAIAALLVPLSLLSAPATTQSPGGTLSQLRQKYDLSQANLGEIDPAGETIKLATLGMRGVAANVLWEKANHYKKVEDWTNLSATLEQITHLQPNFISVWRYQAWNLSYNVSVEFDDYRDRYYWVIKGINFLKEGVAYNGKEPRLLWDTGWFIAQKIGRADEHKQYRKLFKADDDFHGSRPMAQRDNWLVGREWFLRAQDLVDKFSVPIKGTSPLIFHSDPAMCLINYSDAMEEEGTYGEVAKTAWKRADEAWNAYGSRDIPTVHNLSIRLNDKEKFAERAAGARKELDALVPENLAEQIRQERIAKLDAKEKAAFDTPEKDRDDAQRSLMAIVNDKLYVNERIIAERVEGKDRAKALQLAEAAMTADTLARIIDNERSIVNFEYWRLRCEMERTDDALEARKLIFEAEQEFTATHLVAAGEKYEAGLAKWRQVLDAFPALLDESIEMEDLAETISRYREALHQLDKPFPEDFILQDVLDIQQRRQLPAEEAK
jgi:hypothetical protein